MRFIFKRPSLNPLASLLPSFGIAIEKGLAASSQPLFVQRVIVTNDPAIPLLVRTYLDQTPCIS
jgi:hypothetical protein